MKINVVCEHVHDDSTDLAALRQSAAQGAELSWHDKQTYVSTHAQG